MMNETLTRKVEQAVKLIQLAGADGDLVEVARLEIAMAFHLLRIHWHYLETIISSDPSILQSHFHLMAFKKH